MKSLIINHYSDKKYTTTNIKCETLKLEIRAKMIVLTDNENVIFACKLNDFISLAVCEETTFINVPYGGGVIGLWNTLERKMEE